MSAKAQMEAEAASTAAKLQEVTPPPNPSRYPTVTPLEQRLSRFAAQQETRQKTLAAANERFQKEKDRLEKEEIEKELAREKVTHTGTEISRGPCRHRPRPR